MRATSTFSLQGGGRKIVAKHCREHHDIATAITTESHCEDVRTPKFLAKIREAKKEGRERERERAVNV